MLAEDRNPALVTHDYETKARFIRITLPKSEIFNFKEYLLLLLIEDG